MTANPHRKHLVLLGAGRAHILVLKGLARRRRSDLAVTLVTPAPYYIAPELLPGYVAGDHALEEFRIPLDELVEASGVTFVPAHVYSLDPNARRVQLSSGDALPYDVLSVNVEPAVEREQLEQRIPGVREHALFTHPAEMFIRLWPQLLALAQQRPLQVAVMAGDLRGIELAMSAAHAVAAPHGSRVTLVTGSNPPLKRLPVALQRKLAHRLEQLEITVIHDDCVGVQDQAVQLASGATLVCDAPIMTTTASTPLWLAQSGLELDEAGQPVLNERLQSNSHRQVFIAPYHPPMEAGVALESNLQAAITGGTFKKVALHTRRLPTISCGSQHAIASWGPLALGGHEVWRWKTRRDRNNLVLLFDLA
ncbi:MAG: FAD-dependent oxidoreductase [Ottowia sp.]|nr:FAD-dependent oxidoreductase [Ottowia sp.]